MRVVFDTNVYLAALKEDSLAFRILETVFEEKDSFFLYISPDLKTELFEKLAVWETKNYAGPEQIALLKLLINQILEVAPTEKISEITRDPDDNIVLECAVAAGANVIITMDKDLLQLKTFRNIAIMHPKTFSYIS